MAGLSSKPQEANNDGELLRRFERKFVSGDFSLELLTGLSSRPQEASSFLDGEFFRGLEKIFASLEPLTGLSSRPQEARSLREGELFFKPLANFEVKLFVTSALTLSDFLLFDISAEAMPSPIFVFDKENLEPLFDEEPRTGSNEWLSLRP